MVPSTVKRKQKETNNLGEEKRRKERKGREETIEKRRVLKSKILFL